MAELNGGEIDEEWEDDEEDDIAKRFGIEETYAEVDGDSCWAKVKSARGKLYTLLEEPSKGGIVAKVNGSDF